MELQKTKHQVKLEQWRQVIYECKGSGLTVKSWCAENQISLQTYYRWQKKVWDSGLPLGGGLKPVMPDGMTFAEYTPPVYRSAPGSAVTLSIGVARMEIQNGADEQTIEAVIRALSRLC